MAYDTRHIAHTQHAVHHPKHANMTRSHGCVYGRERLVGEREGAARQWESSLRTEQAALHQAAVVAEAKEKHASDREAALKEAEEVCCSMAAYCMCQVVCDQAAAVTANTAGSFFFFSVYPVYRAWPVT